MVAPAYEFSRAETDTLELLTDVERWINIRKNLSSTFNIKDIDKTISDDLSQLVLRPITGQHAIQLRVLERCTTLLKNLEDVGFDTAELSTAIHFRTKRLLETKRDLRQVSHLASRRL